MKHIDAKVINLNCPGMQSQIQVLTNVLLNEDKK